MHVSLDVSSLPYRRGVSRYTEELARALSRQSVIEKITLTGSSSRQYHDLESLAESIQDEQPDKIELLLHRFPVSLLSLSWRFSSYPPTHTTTQPDIFHSWDWIQPHKSTVPMVSTVHDLALLRFPKTAHKKILRQHKHAWKFFKQKQARLIAVSQTTKNDCVELLGYPPYLIDVIYEALPTTFIQTSEALTDQYLEKLRSTHALTKPFILFVGTREPRKNLKRLIAAWKPLAQDVDLIIVGESGWDGVSEHASNSSAQPKFLGRVSDQVLAGLYALADCFAYPSLYEGFGLPILEAFHFGTPVVTSNNSGMREVAGNAAELVEPTDTHSIFDGLQKILSESKENQQKRLQRMIIRSHMFSWDTAASETVQTYQKALQN